ncbi:MAG TPA: VWA domain-containing protein [Bryobacteraceae bacterium]|nr:VWA domain-containing protein [Bryobacteraceae bacterium]
MSRSLLILLAVAASMPAIAAADEVVFRSDVSLVRVDAQVVDRDNRAITGLRADDFILREEGQPQPIRNFASENMPVDVLFLLDVSASMRPHVERIASAAQQALRVLRDEDRGAIMVFDRSTRLRLPFRNNREDVARAFDALLDQETFNGGTDITRALLDAANYVGREARLDARRAIVILTDDQTERNRDVEAVSRALTRADAVLSLLLAPDAMHYYSQGGGGGRRGGGGPWPGSSGPLGGPLGGIILGRRGPNGGRRPGPGMRGPHTQSAGTAEIARRSGGDTMPVDEASALETTLERLRQRYALYFYLPQGVKPGEERGIEVQLASAGRYPGAEVRYRRVYLAPDGSVSAARAGAEPVTISRVPISATPASPEPEVSAPPRLRRRPGVNEDGSRPGPLESEPETAAPAAPADAGQPRQSRKQADQPAPNAPAAPLKEPPCGWHREGEPARPCPTTTTPADDRRSQNH